jgi:Aerotolerance regulator N-terminal
MGLIHPGILLGLLAVAAPIAIHFIRSRKYQRVEIGALRFLRVAIRERRRWRRIEDWPLLLARIAAVILLAFLFARPFLQAKEKVAPADLEVILLLDVSGSVSGPKFAAVRQAARETLAKIPPHTKVTVAVFADDVRALEKPDLDALRAIPGAPTDYVRAVNWTLDHIAQSERKHSHVYLISDLQQAAFPSAPPRVWPSNARVSIIQVPAAGKWNAGIAKVQLLTPYVIEEAVAEVTLSLSGEAPEGKREVQFAIEGQPALTKTIEPPARRAEFRWKPDQEGIVRGVASVASDDAFPEDNRRPFLLRLAHPKRVLVVQSGNPLTPYEGDGYFLEKALAVSGHTESRSPFDPRVQFDLSGLESADAVAWCNSPAPAQDGAQALKEFAMRGGAVSFFLGSATNPADFAALAESGLFPEKIEPVDPPVLRPIESWDHNHEALRRFDGGDRGDLRGVLLRDAFAIESGPDWTVLARLDNGHPVLLARELGKGRVLVFANPLTRAWSDFPTQRIFLPLMKEWFTWLTHFSPDQDAAREIAPGLNEPRAIGTYETGGALEVVAPDPTEMDVTVADEAFARRALGLPGEDAPAPAGENLRLPKFRERQNEIWPWIALALLALLIFETVLSDQRSKSREHDIQ